jgi:enoyl-CoA hydratase
MGGVRVEHDGPVLTLTIDREERRNALDAAVLDGLLAGVQSEAARPEVRVVVVTGAGDKAFCAGADLVAMAPGATGLEQHEGRGGLRELILAMQACPRPIVARVQGLCLAGGVGLALGCDVVLASENAVFGLPEVTLGLWPFMVSALLARHVSPKAAMHLMLSGQRVDGRRGYEIGLVSAVYPADRFDDDVAAYVRALADKPPVAVRLGKAAFAAAADTPLAAGLAAMQAQLSLLTQTEDAVEGVAAFFDKRPPRWTGR